MLDGHSSTTLVRVWLLGAFQVERRTEDGTWETSDKSHWEKGYARPLFKRLLCAGGRRVERLTLADDLWPDPDSPELVERYLNDAAYQLRKALRPVPILKTFGHASGYELAAQLLLWVDADACEALMREAEQIGRTSAPALPLLEQANAYFARGDFLEGESGLWVYARRGTLERLRYRCRIWLAEAYEQQGMMGQAEMLYSQLLEDTPSDEDVLCRLMGLLHRQGMTHAALRCYEATRKHLKHLGLRLSPATDTYAKRLLSEPRPIELYGGTSLTSKKHPLHPSITQDIGSPALPVLEKLIWENMLLRNRPVEGIQRKSLIFMAEFSTGSAEEPRYNRRARARGSRHGPPTSSNYSASFESNRYSSSHRGYIVQYTYGGATLTGTYQTIEHRRENA